jgi:hypothetical protein
MDGSSLLKVQQFIWTNELPSLLMSISVMNEHVPLLAIAWSNILSTKLSPACNLSSTE